MAGLGEVLWIPEDREMWEAEQFARRSMDKQDEQLRRASLVGVGHSVRGVPPWSAQNQFVSAALRGSIER